ncbi:MAG: hypothetical protein MZW92_11195 [Comamonadaceae bacterium]|nr:hypothetical protein [Comamonadaceae bacterium]
MALSLLLHAAVIGLPGIGFLRGPDRTGFRWKRVCYPSAPKTPQDPDAALLKDTLTEEPPDRSPAATTLDVVPRDPQARRGRRPGARRHRTGEAQAGATPVLSAAGGGAGNRR